MNDEKEIKILQIYKQRFLDFQSAIVLQQGFSSFKLIK